MPQPLRQRMSKTRPMERMMALDGPWMASTAPGTTACDGTCEHEFNQSSNQTSTGIDTDTVSAVCLRPAAHRLGRCRCSMPAGRCAAQRATVYLLWNLNCAKIRYNHYLVDTLALVHCPCPPRAALLEKAWDEGVYTVQKVPEAHQHAITDLAMRGEALFLQLRFSFLCCAAATSSSSHHLACRPSKP
jgi:hypothetical protein